MGEPFASQIALCLGRKRQHNHRACLRRQFRFSSGARSAKSKKASTPRDRLICLYARQVSFAWA